MTLSVRKYTKTKPTSVPWLQTVPTHWNEYPVRRLYRQAKRQGYPERTVLSVYRDYGVVPKDSRVDNNNKTPEDVSVYQRVDAEDLVINKMKCWQGSLGVSTHDGITSPDYIVYVPQHQESSRFIHFLLRAEPMPSVYRSISNGIRPSQWRLEPEKFESLVIPLPPLDEQTQIAKFLDYETAKIDQLIDKQQQLIALLKEKRQAVISHAVTKGLNPDAPMKDSGVEWLGQVPARWDVVPLKWAAARIQTGCTPPTETGRYYANGAVPWYGPSSFGEPLSIGRPVKLIHESALTEGKARLFTKGTVLIVGIGATIGKSALASSNCSANQQVTAVEFPRDRLLPEFAAMSIRRLEQVFRDRAQYTTMPIMNQQEIGTYALAVPDVTEQREITARVSVRLNKIDGLVRAASEVAELLKERRTALISAAVTGKIDVRNWKPPEGEATQEVA